MGNCIFKGTGYNFNRLMANSAHCSIVEVEEILEIGELEPEEIHLPAFNVNRLFKSVEYERRIEIAKFSDDDEEKTSGRKSSRDVIAKRAALAFEEGMYYNVGVRIPTLAASYASKLGRHVFMQSENGMIGVGGYAKKGEEDAEWINAVSLRYATRSQTSNHSSLTCSTGQRNDRPLRRRKHLRQQLGLRPNPRRTPRHDRPGRPRNQRNRPYRQLHDPGQDGERDGRSNGTSVESSDDEGPRRTESHGHTLAAED